MAREKHQPFFGAAPAPCVAQNDGGAADNGEPASSKRWRCRLLGTATVTALEGIYRDRNIEKVLPPLKVIL